MPDYIELISENRIEEVFPERRIRLFKIFEKRIAVVRIGKKFYAFDNHCPHSDYPLHEGVINYLNEVVCPWHGYGFNLEHGGEHRNRCGPLFRYVVEIKNEMLRLQLN